MATTTSTYHRPFSPENVKPNPHPYAIKTTSTGALSRSNSIPNKGDNRSRYVPPSPSREEFGVREGETKRMQGRPGHRYSKSLSNSDAPMPIPLPVDEHGGIIFPRSSSPVKEVGRAHTGGSYPSSPTKEEDPVPRAHTGGSFPVYPTSMPPYPVGTPEPSPTGRPLPLPPQAQQDTGSTNPKEWLPSQVAAYLASALRTRNDGEDGPMLPMAVIQDITDIIRREKVTGRVFLRLTEFDLEEMQINPHWRAALLSASRNLKQSVLQGRIWGLGSTPASSPSAKSRSTIYYSSADEEEVRVSTPQRRPLPPEPFPTQDGYLSSSSSTSSLDERGRPTEGRYRNGRVKGMVETFERERSRSESEGSDIYSSPRKPEQRPLPVPPRPADEDDMEYFDVGGTAKMKKGSVRGGEGKFSSVRGSRMNGTGSRRRPVGADLFSNDSAPPMPSAQSIFASYTVEEPPSHKGPQRATTTHSSVFEDEPTIEELLQAEGESQGAMAWEAIEMGETVKRISRPEMKLLGGPRHSGARAWEEEVRRVTVKHVAPPANAIPDFTQEKAQRDGEDDEASRRALSDEGVVVDHELEQVPTKEEEEKEEDKRAKEKEEEEEKARAQLEAAMAQTRALVDALSKRVEEVEGEISAMEARAAARAERASKAPSLPPSVWEALSKIFSDPRRAMVDLSKLVGMKQPRARRSIPSYVLFVSLGMCAVVLKVVMKRTAGAITRR